MNDATKDLDYERRSNHASGNHKKQKDRNIEFVENNDRQSKDPQNGPQATNLDIVQVPKHNLITINGWCSGKRVNMSKDDGCNAKHLCEDFMLRCKHISEIQKEKHDYETF